MPPTKKMPTVMKSGHQFSMVPSMEMSRSVFDRSHGYKTTFDAGLLVPVFLDEVLPGDTFTCKMTALARLTTPLKPFMDNMYLESFFFFVPYRLVWANFVKFMGEQTNPGDSIAFTVPQVTAIIPTVGSVWDYFGLPTAGQVTTAIGFSALPIRAYRLIYNQWFRDENLINSQTVPVTDGPDSYAAGQALLSRGKRHDYFTSCLPFLQKGTAVAAAVSPTTVGGHDIPTFWNVTTNNLGGPLQRAASGAGTGVNIQLAGTGGESLGWADPKLTVLINDLRQAVGVQQFLERDARGGTRYTELIFSHFKVRSPDARLQRAEYLGGGSSPIYVMPLGQTSASKVGGETAGGTTPIGNLTGVGAGIASGHGFSKSFTEHGLIMGLVNVRADLTYSQGIERFWSRSTRYDYFWPVLESLGEQAVLNKEIYATGGANDALVFGYQERYAEYRYKPSRVTGLMRPTAAGTLQIWNLSEKFTALPTLGQTFIEDQTETILDDRVAVPAEPDFIFDSFFDLKCARPMKVFGVPGLHRL